MTVQHIQFCKSFDGADIAYAVTGQGPTVVMLPSITRPRSATFSHSTEWKIDLPRTGF